jgi:hypothetical protein
MNGRISSQLLSPGGQEDEIRRRVALLDGSQRYSLSLWAVPEGVPFDRVDLRSWPEQYIQAAGSHERMMVEVRSVVDDVAQQYVVGTGDAGRPGEAKETISWNGCETAVAAGEVFDSAEAGELFVSYYRSGRVPESYSLRPLRL